MDTNQLPTDPDELRRLLLMLRKRKVKRTIAGDSSRTKQTSGLDNQ